ncbi:hypothetical protein IEO21_03893 [Rhodonia placenta]|uniref:Uncharacterized protein n=1 Tax=Rhodonia placenta TaxID=104341 RepID=A0A8H7P4W1_9APHY|nr:hypothetical protein IEO21_03893 [Postia placenta]
MVYMSGVTLFRDDAGGSDAPLDVDVFVGAALNGAYRTGVTLVGGLWADLLLGGGARFGASLGRVMFAILGRPAFETSESVFAKRRKGVAIGPS